MNTQTLTPEPSTRYLRIYAFDPSLTAQYDTAGIGEITIGVPWERNLLPGPVGEYIEVVDVDPASGVAYKPVDLDSPHLLAQNGLGPSESNPQFHQQMVYAVAMTTIGHFEQALGRVALWSAHNRDTPKAEFVRRLRIYPHALRDRNAYYSPSKNALLFGYFPVGIKDAYNTPGTIVYTCLSHDIVAHETTHALLDGVHPRFSEAVNQDVLAFHEAFADIVALFQHFSYPGVLRDQIARTRGDLGSESLLGQLAQQFGRASGRGHALRDALGAVDAKTGKWKRREPDSTALANAAEPHDRGAILVAAVFGAFLKTYCRRVADLFRIASEGTGVLREGEIHPDLANRLADEAARSAQQTLQMCIRAIDYCPPVGITFGSYLRAIVTADVDVNPDDPLGFRLAFVESFRQWGIQPDGVQSMSVDALVWPAGELSPRNQTVPAVQENAKDRARSGARALRELFKGTMAAHQDIEEEDSQERKLEPWTLESDRYDTWKAVRNNALVVRRWLYTSVTSEVAKELGLVLHDSSDLPKSIYRDKRNRPRLEVHSVRWAVRRSPRGAPTRDLVVELTQRRAAYATDAVQDRADREEVVAEQKLFDYRAGCTLLINPEDMVVRRVIRTRGTIAETDELRRVRRFLTEGGLSPTNAFQDPVAILDEEEPFAVLHHDGEY